MLQIRGTTGFQQSKTPTGLAKSSFILACLMQKNIMDERAQINHYFGSRYRLHGISAQYQLCFFSRFPSSFLTFPPAKFTTTDQLTAINDPLYQARLQPRTHNSAT
ncbi:hypothetical protein CCUS01_04646 [Colletotrichum cuscutae]|uniref:Uncharacterized protein n=1 Tax=Colletotrichum cuscutae TaxID=1209917 RepID=A0AAI9Y5S6_9PEZI|nr:hypothetical protein CCUS01_04646 [Colletotrichum cuscutae]